jgi:type IV pilus assembly protein PilW
MRHALPQPHGRATPAARQRRGVTLIEIMIGLTLGMIVSAALLLVFANASHRNAQVQRTSSQIENGRFMAELLRDELQMAGYFGEAATDGAAFSSPDPCETTPSGFGSAPLTVPAALRGFRASDSVSCLSARNRRAGTDAVALRRVEVTTTATTAMAASSNRYYVQTSFCDDDASTLPLVFDRRPAELILRNRACTGPNPARAYISRIYFVASCNVCGGDGVASDNVPTLKRIDLVGSAWVETALVEGIEAFRIEYGFDDNNNGNVDQWAAGPASSGPVSLWENVMAVRVHYIVRSLDPVPGGALAGAQSFSLGDLGQVTVAADGFARKSYSLTIRLINPSSRKENS